MANTISIDVQDNVPGSLTAAKISTIVSNQNEIAIELNNLRAQFLATQRMTSLLEASLNLPYENIPGDGVARGLAGWSVNLNVGSAFNAGNGIFTVSQLGQYEVKWKSLISGVNAVSPRAKMWLSKTRSGQPVADELSLDEQELGVIVGQYRQSFRDWWRGTLSPGDIISLQVQLWTSNSLSQLRINNDRNTLLLIDRVG